MCWGMTTRNRLANFHNFDHLEISFFLFVFREGAKNRLRGGALFRAAFGRAWVPPPFSAALGYTPPIWDDHLVSPPIPDELLPSPPFPKIYFFQKVRMRFATFLYYPKRHDVIKFKVLCHWISLIWMTRSANKLIWMVKTLKLGDMRAQRENFFGYGSRPPPHFPVF